MAGAAGSSVARAELYEVRQLPILVSSARGEWVSVVHREMIGCNDQDGPEVLREFERDGLDACSEARDRVVPPPSDARGRGRTRADPGGCCIRSGHLRHRRSSVWTMELWPTGGVSFAEGIHGVKCVGARRFAGDGASGPMDK